MENLLPILNQITGYIYPNEVELHWRLLIVLYPYLTGVVAGAFILASLVKVFNVKDVQPTYRLSLLTALAFLIVAPMPLLAHIGHPEKAYEIFLTPNSSSAMAMFGFVYAWYLMAVLVLEIWFDYRRDLILQSKTVRGIKKGITKIFTLFSTDISEKAIRFDKKAVKAITIIGIPSAFLLHGYVGFIFGSIKANPWWSSVLMPIVFLFSAIVSGIAMVLILYMVTTLLRKQEINMACLDKIASFLFYAMIIDFSLEALDFVHRLYESEESITILGQMISSRLFVSLIVLQLFLGMLVPLGSIAGVKFFRAPAELKRIVYFVAALLVELGIFTTRWNVVVGGQLFSKSFRGLTVYKMQIGGIEGLLVSAAFLMLPFLILFMLVKIFPPWPIAQQNPEIAPPAG